MTAPGSLHDGADLAPGDAPTPDPGAGVTEAGTLQAAVLACPAVAGMAVATTPSPPGHDVTGIRLTDDTVEAHVVAVYGVPISEVGDRIGDAVAPLLAGRSLHVFVDDLAPPAAD